VVMFTLAVVFLACHEYEADLPNRQRRLGSPRQRGVDRSGSPGGPSRARGVPGHCRMRRPALATSSAGGVLFPGALQVIALCMGATGENDGDHEQECRVKACTHDISLQGAKRKREYNGS